MPKAVLLAVDDDEQELRLLERDLERVYDERYRVLGARSGREALEQLRQLQRSHETVALLLVDQRMPDVTGVELLAQAIGIVPDAKRVLLTTYADAPAVISAKALIRREIDGRAAWLRSCLDRGRVSTAR